MGKKVELLCFGALASATFTPFSMQLAYGIGALDRPDGVRKHHAVPTPRLGGIALFVAVFLIGLWLIPPSALRGVWLSGGALLCALGVSDDVFSLSAPIKLLAQSAIATLPVAFGTVPRFFTLGHMLFTPPPWLCNTVTLLWILLLTNAFNLIDGIDTLCASQAMLSAAALFFLGRTEAALLFGAALGFLPYNRPAAALRGARIRTRTFLGDTGALFLGYSLAILSLGGEQTSVFLPLLFAFPLIDCLFSFLRRIAKGKSPFEADEGHLHHLLLRRTKSAFRTVILLALISAAAILLFYAVS